MHDDIPKQQAPSTKATAQPRTSSHSVHQVSDRPRVSSATPGKARGTASSVSGHRTPSSPSSELSKGNQSNRNKSSHRPSNTIPAPAISRKSFNAESRTERLGKSKRELKAEFEVRIDIDTWDSCIILFCLHSNLSGHQMRSLEMITVTILRSMSQTHYRPIQMLKQHPGLLQQNLFSTVEDNLRRSLNRLPSRSFSMMLSTSSEVKQSSMMPSQKLVIAFTVLERLSTSVQKNSSWPTSRIVSKTTRSMLVILQLLYVLSLVL